MLGFENVSWNGSSGSVNKARRKCHFAHVKLLVTFPLETVHCSPSPRRLLEWKCEPCQEVSSGTRTYLTNLPIKIHPNLATLHVFKHIQLHNQKRGMVGSFQACSLVRLRFGKARRCLSLWQCEGGNNLNYVEAAWKVRAGLKDEVWRRHKKTDEGNFLGRELGLRWEGTEWFSVKKMGLG